MSDFSPFQTYWTWKCWYVLLHGCKKASSTLVSESLALKKKKRRSHDFKKVQSIACHHFLKATCFRHCGSCLKKTTKNRPILSANEVFSTLQQVHRLGLVVSIVKLKKFTRCSIYHLRTIQFLCRKMRSWSVVILNIKYIKRIYKQKIPDLSINMSVCCWNSISLKNFLFTEQLSSEPTPISRMELSFFFLRWRRNIKQFRLFTADNMITGSRTRTGRGCEGKGKNPFIFWSCLQPLWTRMPGVLLYHLRYSVLNSHPVIVFCWHLSQTPPCEML